jgi:hypothetical protein
MLLKAAINGKRTAAAGELVAAARQSIMKVDASNAAHNGSRRIT